jgi:hypothetical protein
MFAQQHTHYAALIAMLIAWLLFGLITRIPLIHKAIRIFFPWRAHVAIEYNNNYGTLKERGWTIVFCGKVACRLEKYLAWALVKAFWGYLRWPLTDKQR